MYRPIIGLTSGSTPTQQFYWYWPAIFTRNRIISVTSMNSKRSRIAFNDLSVVVQDHRTEIDAAIDSVLKSGHYILGPQVEAFEYEFARYCGLSCNGVGVANGTDALELALRALDIGPGHEVITVANAGVPTT